MHLFCFTELQLYLMSLTLRRQIIRVTLSIQTLVQETPTVQWYQQQENISSLQHLLQILNPHSLIIHL